MTPLALPIIHNLIKLVFPNISLLIILIVIKTKYQDPPNLLVSAMSVRYGILGEHF